MGYPQTLFIDLNNRYRKRLTNTCFSYIFLIFISLKPRLAGGPPACVSRPAVISPDLEKARDKKSPPLTYSIDDSNALHVLLEIVYFPMV